MSTTAQRTLRALLVSALRASTGVDVKSPGDWETPGPDLPEIKVRSPGNRKSSIARAGANFTTMVTLEVIARVGALDAEGAQDKLDALLGRIEDTVFLLPSLMAQVQQIATIDTETSITARTSEHVGEARVVLQCETFESAEITDAPYAGLLADLKLAVVNVDTTNPFDAQGAYSGSAFPLSVVPAPRTRGPDGRNEATLHIEL